MSGPVACLGESMVRLTTDWDVPLEAARSLRLHVAGAESNVAIALARLGRPARWISALPPNALGRFVATQIRGHGVDVDHVCWTDGRVGLYFTELGGPPRGTDVIYDRQDSSFATCSPDAIDWSALDGIELLHLTGITPALRPKGRELFRRARKEAELRGVPVSVDANYRAYLWPKQDARETMERLCSGVEAFLISWRDLVALFPDIVTQSDEGNGFERSTAALAKLLDCDLVAVTLGRHGAGAIHQGAWKQARAVEAEPADPIGRGDAFAAGFLWRWLATRDVWQGLQAGAAAAALAQTYRGDVAWFTPELVERVIAGERIELRR
jgi:2-dehydro-3-deoxygluconokinase